MKRKSIIVIIGFGLLLLGAIVTWHFTGHVGLSHGEHSHSHNHEHGGGESLELNAGKKWATDEPLRDGMSRIHERVKPAYAAYQKGELDADMSKKMAEMIRGEVDILIKNCALDPKADAMLHIVIGNMLSAASEMEGNPASEEGMPKLVEALHAYSKHFDHPNF